MDKDSATYLYSKCNLACIPKWLDGEINFVEVCESCLSIIGLVTNRLGAARICTNCDFFEKTQYATIGMCMRAFTGESQVFISSFNCCGEFSNSETRAAKSNSDEEGEGNC
nr:hypothetical protein [Candidatus Freyarchaeota archaeon]